MSCFEVISCPPKDLRWYALQTRAKAEASTAAGLQAKGYELYYPSFRARRRWSDRIVEATVPLFTGYIFSRFDVNERIPVLTTSGVLSIVGVGARPIPILDSEIEGIREAVNSGLNIEPCPYLREGQRIRVMHGALKGMEGILVKKKSQWRLVISVSLLQRSICVELGEECVVAA